MLAHTPTLLYGSSSSQSTSPTDLDSTLPDTLMIPLPENLGSIYDQSSATPTLVEDRIKDDGV